MTDHSLLISVVIPTFNGSAHLGEAIQSVLDQTYSHLEIIVVDDASSDRTPDVVEQIRDGRVKYIRHTVNKGANAARATGTEASTGEIVAYLDQDDLFHPEKLQAHVDLIRERPDVGMTYNSRFELNHPSSAIRGIWRFPREITLADLIEGFAIAPSEVVLARKWADKISWSQAGCFYGGEIILFSRLMMAGCKLALVDKALNYRRYFSRRRYSDLEGACNAELSAQRTILSEPHCPIEVRANADRAYRNTYRVYAYYALAQEDTDIGQRFLSEAVRLDPSLVSGRPCDMVRFLADNSIRDDSIDHEVLLHTIFDQLPFELISIKEQLDWAVSYGYLWKGTRATIWDRLEDGREYFDSAAKLGASVDDAFIGKLAYELLCYDIQFGSEAADDVVRRLTPHLDQICGNSRKLKGTYYVNRAFRDYQRGYREQAFWAMLRAVIAGPQHITNRGVVSVLFRSMNSAFSTRALAK